MPANSTNAESGNVFMIILLAVVLFGALGLTVSRSFQSDTASALSDQELSLVSDEILNHLQKLERTIGRLQSRNNCSETEISFENDIASGYNFSTRDACKVFHPSGGNLKYKTPNLNWLDSTHSALTNYGQWYFTSSSCIDDLGTGGTDCDTDNSRQVNELFAVLKYLKPNLCGTLNDKLHGEDIIAQESNALFAEDSKFTNGFPTGVGNNIGQAQGRSAQCLEGNNAPSDEPSGSYHFYYVLQAR